MAHDPAPRGRGQRLRYDGEALNRYRNLRSHYGGAYAGKWPLHVDAHDIRHVWFRDPSDDVWHQLTWEQAPSLGAPFSFDAVEYAKKVALQGVHVDNPSAAVYDLFGIMAARRGDDATSSEPRPPPGCTAGTGRRR